MTTAEMLDENEIDFTGGTEESKKEAEKNRPIFADSLLRPDFLSFKEGDAQHMVRFLDDEKENEHDRRKNVFIGVQEHGFVKPVPKPDSFTSDKWPEQKGAVCRRDRAFKPHYPQGCYICDNNLPKASSSKGEHAAPSQRIFARVVLREKFTWTQEHADAGLCSSEMVGKKGIRDKTKEVTQVDADGKSTGEKVTVPDIRLLAGSQKNLFSHLTAHAQAHLEDEGTFTILHCDWRIKRGGFTANDTTYTVTQVPGSMSLPAGEFATKEFPYWDVNNPAIYEYYTSQVPWTLRGYLISLASDEHYNRWFIPGGWDIEEQKREEAKNGSKAKTPKPTPVDEDDDEEGQAVDRPTTSASKLDEDDEDEASNDSRLSDLRDKTRRRMSAGAPPARKTDSVDDDDEDYDDV